MRFGRKGSGALEFLLLGIPSLFLTLSVVEMSLGMWQYHTLAESAAAGARYVITHGADCSGTCGINVGNVLTKIANTGVGLNSNNLSVTLTSTSGSNTYSPVSSYLTSTTAFPPAADSTAGNDITVTLSYTVANPFTMFWPGAASMMEKNLTLQAVSRQRIVF